MLSCGTAFRLAPALSKSKDTPRTARAATDAAAATAVFQVVAVPAEGNLVKYSSARV
jgi:hypothetical protein